jgi:signal transduction histidine kinase/ligand-binding sensor domain-containing protein/DNA-binding response OmpR family regulator
MRFQKWVLLLWCWVGGMSLAWAEVPDPFRFSLLDLNSGLSSNQVKCVLKDSRGYVWVGTAAGLNRYDGYRCKVFRYHSNDPTSLSNNDVLQLREGPAGKIWVKTSQGICVYDPDTEQFIRKQARLLRQMGLPADARVEDILQEKSGNFWFVLQGKGLARYNPHTHRSVLLQHSLAEKGGLSTNTISAIGQTTHGDIWLVHRNGLLEKLNPQTLKIEERIEAIYRTNSQQQLDYALTVDSDNDLWLYLREKEGGVFFYDYRLKTLQHFLKTSPRLPLSSNLTRGIVEGEKGKIWIGADHGGINVLDKRTWAVQAIRYNGEVENGLAHNSINTLYKDNESIVWVGTFKKGVNYYHKNIIRFPSAKHLGTVPESLPYEDINTFAEDDKGNLWLGTNGGGLLYLDRGTGVYTRYRHNPQDATSLAADVVVNLLIDKNKQLWVGTYLGGLDRFNGKAFVHYKNQPGNPATISDNSIWELYEDRRGNLWIGTLRGGLEMLDPARKKFTHSSLKGGQYPVHCDYISSIAEDRHGNLWVAGGYGIDIFHPETGKSSLLLHDPSNPQSLVSNQITAIFKDSRHNMWVGTTEGLDLYQEKTGAFLHFSPESGVPNSAISALAEDRHGNLWVSTQNGVFQMERQKLAQGGAPYAFRTFDELDGLQGKSFNERAGLRLKSGEVVFGGPNGFNLFHPDRIEKNAVAPQVVFTDFQLFNKSLVPRQPVNGRVILPKTMADTRQITLEHDENAFSIEFAALNYIHPEKNRYRYKLEGFDHEWHTVDSDNRKISYTNLDPGQYTFTVLAANNDGVWNQQGASLQLEVLAPFWQTPLAYAGYVLLAVAALVGVRRQDLRKAHSRFVLEQERREAQQLHELDRLKIKFFTNVSHEFRTPLTLILAPLEKLLGAKPDPAQQQQFLMIQKNARRLLHMVNQLLDFKKMGVEEMQLSLTEGNVVAFVEETVQSFLELSDKKEISLTFQSGVDSLYVAFDHDKLEKVLLNLLSNAFKFTPAQGRIEVVLQCQEQKSLAEGFKMLEIQVRDTGIGIAKENQTRIFERFFRDAVPEGMMNQGSGIGLALASEFVHLHGGFLSVESAPGQGSCFTVSLPVKELNPPAASPEEQMQQASSLAPAPEHSPVEIGPQETIVGQKPLVLVVEDNDDFRFYLKDNLQGHYQVVEARNGKEGWQKALALLPALIVSDVMMPELNGVDFCKKIKQDPRTSHIPFVLLTAHASEEKHLTGLHVGANDYLTKPFNFELLLSRIKNLITQREQLQKVLEKKISVQTSQEKIVSLDDKLIQKAIKYVEENLSNTDLTVEEMSRELGVSRVHLYKKMVAITGQSPVEFIRKIRLQHAAQLLGKSQLTVAEVAYKVGFNNRKYFTKYFKEEYQMLPSVYAEQKAQVAEK